MDEEELGTTGKKITIANFFESIKKIDKVASDALESSNKNFEEIKVAKETLKGLQSIVTSLQTDVQALKENDKIRENERKDRILEQQDAIQKQEMVARAEGVKGEKGDRGAPGAPGAPGSRRTGEDRKATPKEQGFFGSLFSGAATIGSLIAGSPLGIGAMLGGPFGAVLGGMGLGRFGGKRPKPDQGKLAGGIMETINPFARLGGMFGRKKDEKKEVKEEIKSEIKKELNLKDDKVVEKGEKKENKLMNFVKQGGVAGFLGRKIFGKKEKENKAQEVDATNPESSTFSTDIQYSGRLGPGLKFIVDESSLGPGVTPERAEQHYYKKQINILEGDFREDVIFKDMNRETAIDVYGPESNLYRFKENYNDTLEYGGYELDVGKHYDFVKKSYSSSNKKDKKENKLMDFVKGGGVAGFLGRKLFGKKDEEGKGINTYSDEGGEVKEEKKENKLMDFVKGGGVAGFLGRKLFGKKDDTDDEKSKGERVTYTDGGKRLTVDKGGYLDSLSKEDAIQKFTELNDRRVKSEVAAKKGDKSLELKGFEKRMLRNLGIILEDKFDVNTRSIKTNVGLEIKGKTDDMGLIEVDPDLDFPENPYEKKISIEPVVESNEKDFSSNIYQNLGIDNLNDTVSQLVTQNIAQNGNAVDQNTAIPVPANEPQVSDAEIKNAAPNIPFISLLTGTSKKYSQITSSDEASSVAGYLD